MHHQCRSSHVSCQAQGPVPSFQFSISEDRHFGQHAQTLCGEAPCLREVCADELRGRQCTSVA